MSCLAKWNTIKRPFAAAIGVVIGAVCALTVTDAGIVVIDPSSIVFVTVLLVDMSSSESFYITATFRLLGTLLGLAVGAIVSFANNAIYDDGEHKWGMRSFQIVVMAVCVFIPFYIEQQYPKYAYASIIFVFNVTALIFSGTSKAITIAVIASLLGGIVIATVVMWIFNYESAEVPLLRDHLKLVRHSLTMVKISVRANPRYRDDYFRILDETKAAFDTNIDNITNYNRWLRWTRRKPQSNFVAMTQALRPLFHQTASMFWSLCRERTVPFDEMSFRDARYFYCLTSEQYFEFFHDFVTALVDSIDRIDTRLTVVLKSHPHKLLGTITKSILGKQAHSEVTDHVSALRLILKDDVTTILRTLVRMKYRYASRKATTHPNFSQQWLFSDYIFQINLVLIELLEYLQLIIETVVVDPEKVSSLSRATRAIMIRAEAVMNDGFLQARSFDESNQVTEEAMLRLVSLETDDDFELDSVVSNSQADQVFDDV